MLDIQAFIKEIKSRVPATYYPNLFPAKGANNCVVVSLSPVLSSRGDIKTFDVVFYIRAENTQSCMDIGKKLIETLDYETKLVVNGVQVVLITATDTIPVFQGKDANNLYIYRVNLKMLVDIPIIRK